MDQLFRIFRNRIGFPENEKIPFEKLDVILQKVSRTIPFEKFTNYFR
ncbi:hypothetical protein [Halobacillus sp. Marseille-Q1614]|nr:hypothetical protein [Halobacillus sp. Marseille-Q1614]